MARPKKKGLDYFPLDVDIFEDDKLFDVQNTYGPLGEIIYIRLLCLVYKNGYYYKFDSLDKLAAMIIRSVGNRWARDKKTVIEVISFLAKCNLFSLELMQENILTSRSIQMRYLQATERRQSNSIDEYNLLENQSNQEGLINAHKNQVNVYNNSINVCNNSENVNDNTQSKVKESKVNKSKVCSPSKFSIPCINGIFEVTEKFYNELTTTYPNINIDLCLNNIIFYLTNHTNKRFNTLSAESYIKRWICKDASDGKNLKQQGNIQNSDTNKYAIYDVFG